MTKLKIADGILAALNTDLAAFTDVQVQAGQAMAFKVPLGAVGGYVRSGDPITHEDIADFVCTFLGVRRKSDDGPENNVDWLRSYLENASRFNADHSLTCGDARLRVHIRTNGSEQHVGLSIRKQPRRVPSPIEIGLAPAIVRELQAGLRPGLYIFTGPMGVGKSTSMASCLEFYNEHRSGHILLLEDPIEYELDTGKQCVITQRQVNDFSLAPNALTYERALIEAKREAPDVLMIGELRTPETCRRALHMSVSMPVLTTLHASSPASCIMGILNWYDERERDAIRSLLASNLRWVQSQRLIPGKDHKGWVLGYELFMIDVMTAGALLSTSNDNTTQLTERTINEKLARNAHAQHLGTITMQQRLRELVKGGRISLEAAREAAIDKEGFEKLMATHGLES